MAYQVIYTNRANDSLIGILEYIEDKWGAEKATSILIRVYEIVDLLAAFPTMGRLEVRDKGIRAFIIDKRLKVFYRI